MAQKNNKRKEEVLEKIFRILFFSGLKKDEWKYIRNKVDRQNRTVWIGISILFFSFFTIQLVASIVRGTYRNWPFFVGGMVYYITTLLLLIFVGKKSGILVSIIMYLSTAINYSYAIMTGTLLLDFSSTSFLVFLILSPIVITDRPYRLNLLSVVASTIFFIVVPLGGKSEVLYKADRFDLTIVLLGSIFINIYLSYLKINSFTRQFHIEKQIYIDPLTGLGNELGYLEMNDYINNKINNGDTSFAVIMLDVNEIKNNNDKYGHKFGCALIVETGKYIKRLFRTSKLFHVGGDEFVIIVEGTDFDNKDKVINKFDKDMSDYFITIDNIKIRLSVARGISQYEKEGETYRTIFDRADKNMYENKVMIKEKLKITGR